MKEAADFLKIDSHVLEWADVTLWIGVEHKCLSSLRAIGLLQVVHAVHVLSPVMSCYKVGLSEDSGSKSHTWYGCGTAATNGAYGPRRSFKHL